MKIIQMTNFVAAFTWLLFAFVSSQTNQPQNVPSPPPQSQNGSNQPPQSQNGPSQLPQSQNVQSQPQQSQIGSSQPLQSKNVTSQPQQPQNVTNQLPNSGNSPNVNSDTVSLTISNTGSKTIWDFEYSKSYEQMANEGIILNPVLNKKTSYNSYNDVSMRLLIPPNAASANFTFTNQNCIFPIVCVSEKIFPAPVYLTNGVSILCDISAFDSKFTRITDTQVKWNYFRVYKFFEGLDQRIKVPKTNNIPAFVQFYL
jgi:hypothetical protein